MGRQIQMACCITSPTKKLSHFTVCVFSRNIIDPNICAQVLEKRVFHNMRQIRWETLKSQPELSTNSRSHSDGISLNIFIADKILNCLFKKVTFLLSGKVEN